MNSYSVALMQISRCMLRSWGQSITAASASSSNRQYRCREARIERRYNLRLRQQTPLICIDATGLSRYRCTDYTLSSPINWIAHADTRSCDRLRRVQRLFEPTVPIYSPCSSSHADHGDCLLDTPRLADDARWWAVDGSPCA